LKLPQPWKSREAVAFGSFSLMDFHRCLKKALRKRRYGFFTVTTGPTTIKLTMID
jgi:hypothetical protein